MTEIEQEYYNKSLNLKPIDYGNSLHIQHFIYHIDKKKVSLYYAIGSNDEPMIEIEDESRIDWKKAYENLLEEIARYPKKATKKEIKQIENTLIVSRGHF